MKKADELSKNFNKMIENKKKTEMKNAIPENENTLKGNRLEDVEEPLSDLEDRVIGSTQAEK